MEDGGIKSLSYENAIPLLAHPDDIDPSSIITEITKISQAPELKLSKQGEKRVKGFSGAGGSHRTEALKTIYEKIGKKIEHLGSKISALKEKKGKRNRLIELQEERKRLMGKKAGLGKWTVKLYNEGK
jgi:hypothetical protein